MSASFGWRVAARVATSWLPCVVLASLTSACTLDRSALGGFAQTPGDAVGAYDPDPSNANVGDERDAGWRVPRDASQEDAGARQLATDAGSDAALGAADAGVLGLSSPSIMSGGLIPATNACSGADISPALSWPHGPAGTVSYAVVLRRIDTGPYDPTSVLWVLWDIPSDVTSLPEDLGANPMPPAIPGAKQVSGAASSLRRYYQGPCGTYGHVYQFLRYALPAMLGGSVLASPATMQSQIGAATPLEILTLVARYAGP